MCAFVDKMPIYFLPEFATYDDFAGYVEHDLQAAGVNYNADTLTGWIDDYASAYEEKYGVNPHELPSIR